MPPPQKTKNLQCRRHSVCLKVSLYVPPCEHNVSKTTEGNFTQFWSQMYLGS